MISQQLNRQVPVPAARHLLRRAKPQHAKIHMTGVANPKQRFSQQEIVERIGISNPRLKKFFEHEHIAYRYLYLPDTSVTLSTGQEQFGDLLKRFIEGAEVITANALQSCLQKAKLKVHDIDFICCVTSSGFTVPSLSARFIERFKFREECQRADIVGMGCSAGLNGLSVVSKWSEANPVKNALLICVEVCSAIYALDETPRTAVVNSLFGDGAAVALINAGNHSTSGNVPVIIDFESHLIPESMHELRFDWDVAQSRYNFYVGRNTPQIIAAVVDKPLQRILNRHHLNKDEIKHWIIHGGGNSVLMGIQKKLQLSDYDLRHTRSVLADFGNLSSGSFLFSFNRFKEERSACRGDYGLMITMGPGLAIEMALLKW